MAESMNPVAIIGSTFQLLYARESWSEGVSVGMGLYTAAQLEQARREEREACARVCEEHPDGMSMLGGAFVACAAAIRARNEKGGA